MTQMAALRVGDPLDPQTQIGPLATVAILEELDRQVQKTLALGAQLLVGGRRLDRPWQLLHPHRAHARPPGQPNLDAGNLRSGGQPGAREFARRTP